MLVTKYELSIDELEELKKYLIKCLDRRSLSKSKEVIYDKEKNIMYKRGIKDAMKSFAGIDLGDFSDGTRGRMEDGIFAEAVCVYVLNVLCSL